MFTFPRMISIPAPRPLRCPWLKQGAFQKVAKAALLFGPPILMMSTRVCVYALFILLAPFPFLDKTSFRITSAGEPPRSFTVARWPFAGRKERSSLMMAAIWARVIGHHRNRPAGQVLACWPAGRPASPCAKPMP